MDKISLEYNEAVQRLKQLILENQLAAAQAVNKQLLALYYSVGKFVSENSRNQAWGTGAIRAISEQLQRELPGLKGFSEENIKKMRRFYEQWAPIVNRSPSATDLQLSDNQSEQTDCELLLVNRSPAATDLDWADFFAISFSHHMEIINKVSNNHEICFYIHTAAKNHWDKYTLRDYLKADLYHHQGTMPNNFITTLSKKQEAYKAISMFKDEYLLDFINVEELGANADDMDERVIENTIVQNIKNFILTFGKDFAYVGHQVHLEKFKQDLWADLLFYNRELRSLVVVELKKGKFKPSYLGQLAAYMRILNDDERKPCENPVIGIILCREANRSYVEYLLQDYNQPMGVATYQTMPDQLKAVLPNEEKLLALMDTDQE